MSRSLFFIVAVFLIPALAAALESGDGRYEYYDSVTGKTINVWYNKPKSFDADTPILIVMHGMSRDAKHYRDDCKPDAEKKGMMLLVPEFTQKDFPGDPAYNWGNIAPKKDAGAKAPKSNRRNPKPQWTFCVVDRVFDDFVKTRETSKQERYYLYGHSAGAQFVHRLALLFPEAKTRMIACANAGSYAVPDAATAWPYGIRNAPVDDAMVVQFLASPLIVLLGEADNDPEAKNLTRTPRADKQGTNRFERGKYFFEFGRKEAETRKVPFAWKMKTVAGATHRNKPMFEAAVDLFADDVKSAKFTESNHPVLTLGANTK